ncbi:MAG: sugar porter family MFS transporter [Pseudomonadota bacterium]
MNTTVSAAPRPAIARVNLSLTIGLAIGAALGGLLFGYDTAVISGAIESIDHQFIAPRTDLSEMARNSLSGSAVGIALWGCVLGSLIAGPLATRLGRRTGMLIAAFLFLVSSVLSAYPEAGLGTIGGMGPAALTPFMVYRFIGGVAIGMASLISPMYIAEIAPPRLRGLLVTFQQIAIVSGMLLVYFVNLKIAQFGGGNDNWVFEQGWRHMLASAAVPSVLFFLAALCMPDTPHWYALKGRDAEALAILERLGDEQDPQQALAGIKASLHKREGALFSYGVPLIAIGVLLSVFQQFSGINAVLYYAPLMFKNVGSATDSALLQTMIVGVANVAFTMVALVCVDRWGRKPLLILGGLIMAASMATLGLLFHTRQEGTLMLIAAIFYIGGFALSWGPVVWVLLSELFPTAIKGRAMAVAVSACWIANWLVTWSFKVLDGDSGLNAEFNHGFTYYVYAGFSLAAALFVWKWIPETKGLSLEQIERFWSKKQ